MVPWDQRLLINGKHLPIKWLATPLKTQSTENLRATVTSIINLLMYLTFPSKLLRESRIQQTFGRAIVGGSGLKENSSWMMA
jgi:hypothetical protein